MSNATSQAARSPATWATMDACWRAANYLSIGRIDLLIR
jgi:hypothetical protein